MKEFEGKLCRIIINEGSGVSVYNGKIISISDDFITIVDKFGVTVSINKDAVVKIELRDTTNE